ncbi:major capsid protein [Fusobacterium hominis]|uniref:Major capsid protein n=1 Tax=Fusobacterium hominis TaxID=2764326 RepID=A0A7G9GXH8_9FUSO|nr:major capsid protein [Fusobacterium hominis]QNM15510.1 major capsid protein [Fusobacterium hominis]
MERNMFTLVNLTKIYKQIKKPQISIWDKLIAKEVTKNTTKFEVQTKSAGRLRAPLVSAREKGVFIEKEAFEVTMYQPGLIKLYTINTAESLLEQHFGQTIYAENQDNIAKKELAESMIELRDISTRTKIWMLLTLLTTGVCPTGDGTAGVKYDKDFKQIALTSNDTFKNPQFDIVKWVEDRQNEIFKSTGIVIDSLVMAPDVVSYFLANEKVKEDQKNVNVNLIQLNQNVQRLDNGMKLVGFIPSLNITVYSYIDWAKEPGEKEETQLLPEKTIVGFKANSFTVYYGALALRPKQGENAQLFVEKEIIRPFYPEASEDNEIQYFSAPLIMPEDAKGYFAAKVLE